MSITTTSEATLDLKAGDVVEVRSADEIYATLDQAGEFESLPFMPEMLQYCGQRLTVAKVAGKLCDTIGHSGMRRMTNAVHLTDSRCDGQAHGGCQAGCLLYWKTAWLKRVDPATVPSTTPTAPNGAPLLPLLHSAVRGQPASDGTETFRCQATEILRAAPDTLPVRNLGQYVNDVRSGNVSTLWSLRALLVTVFDRIQDVSSQKLPRWLQFRQGRHWGFLKGTAQRTPTGRSELRPGELVRIKSKQEIMKTLDSNLCNRGLGFQAEMARYCGRTARVARRVDKIIDERTGQMRHMRNPCIVLEGVVCEGAYSANCPRAIFAYWREIWLERVDESNGTPQQVA